MLACCFFFMLIPLRLSEPHNFSLRFSAAFPPRFSAICAFRLLCSITYVSFIVSIYHIIYLATIHNQHTVHLIHLELMHAHKSIKRHVPTHHRPPQLLLQAQTPPCLILPPPPCNPPPPLLPAHTCPSGVKTACRWCYYPLKRVG